MATMVHDETRHSSKHEKWNMDFSDEDCLYVFEDFQTQENTNLFIVIFHV